MCSQTRQATRGYGCLTCVHQTMIEIIGVVAGIIAAIAAVVQVWPRNPQPKPIPPPPDPPTSLPVLSTGPAEQGVSAPRADRPSRLDEILRTKSIVVGCFRFPPMIDYAGTRGHWTAHGLYASIIEEVATRFSLEVKYVPIRSSEIVSALESASVDIVPCVFSTPGRRVHGDIVAVLHRVRLRGVVRKREPRVRCPEDLHRPDVRIVVARGEIGWEYALRYLDLETDPFRRFYITDGDRVEDMMHLIRTGEFDIALADALSCAQYISRNKSTVAAAFRSDPLDLYDAGTMIRTGDAGLASWIHSNFVEVRSLQHIRAMEEEILEQFPGVFVAVQPQT